MRSIKSVYKVGNGPSSSHTVGPYSAAKLLSKRYPDAFSVKVMLQGSLAFTGAGHSTGKAVQEGWPLACVVYDFETPMDTLPFPNTMVFEITRKDQSTETVRVFSVGGGSIRIEGEPSEDDIEVYPQKNFSEMLDECRRCGITLTEFIYRQEGESIRQYLEGIWYAMAEAVERGLKTEGILPGGLNITRKAKMLHEKRVYNENTDITMNRVIASYAYAVSEENACEHIVVTAPTCGSCGVIPSVFYYMWKERGFPEDEIIDALAVAGLVGNVIRTNASISGAECGCQAEIGSACSMAAGGLAALQKMTLEEIEYAAENAMEHNLGLTCDPVMGLVQIPCIERNAVAAMRAVSSVNLAHFLSQTRQISFDEVIATMYQTGKDLNEKYRESSHGGLAVMYADREKALKEWKNGA